MGGGVESEFAFRCLSVPVCHADELPKKKAGRELLTQVVAESGNLHSQRILGCDAEIGLVALQRGHQLAGNVSDTQRVFKARVHRSFTSTVGR